MNTHTHAMTHTHLFTCHEYTHKHTLWHTHKQSAPSRNPHKHIQTQHESRTHPGQALLPPPLNSWWLRTAPWIAASAPSYHYDKHTHTLTHTHKHSARKQPHEHIQTQHESRTHPDQALLLPPLSLWWFCRSSWKAASAPSHHYDKHTHTQAQR